MAAVFSAVTVVDLRSDTLTLPTEKMRKAMASAVVGDDVFGEDPTVRELEALAAEMFGKEEALFVPSGTMGNLIAAMTHCWERGSMVYLGDQSHMYNWEQGGIAQIGGIIPKALSTKLDGTFDVVEMVRNHMSGENYHNAKPRLLVVENPINGKVLPLSFMEEAHDAARRINLKIHLDGARIGNATTALNCKPTDITKWVDSANVCLSKGLGAPVGSVVVGSVEFIAKARRMRKVLGGGMRQCGILAAAGIISLTEMMNRLQQDHDNAKRFANGILNIAPDIFDFNMDDIQTNMVWLKIRDGINCSGVELSKMMAEPMEGNTACIKIMSLAKQSVRAVFHNGVGTKDVDCALEKVKIVCQHIRAST